MDNDLYKYKYHENKNIIKKIIVSTIYDTKIFNFSSTFCYFG